MDDDLNPEIPDDASELEFLQQEQDIAKFEAGYDEPIDNKFLHNYIGARQMSYGGDELQIIEDTAFSKIMDYMDANDIHYSDIDVYDFIPEDKRLSPYLIFQQGVRNEYYTDDFVEYMIAVTRRTPSGIYDANLDEVIPAPPSHHMAEYALKAANAKGPEAKLIEQAKIIGGEYTDAALKKLKFKKFFMGVSITAKPRDVVIRFVNNLFPGGSYEAYLEESQRVAMEKMGMTPEGDWLPEVKEKMIIKSTDVDGNVTYTDFYGNEVSPDDPRISDKSKLEDLEEQFKTPMEDLPPEEQVKRMVDEGILTEYEGEQALDKKGNWAVREIDDITVKGIFTSTPTDVRGPSFVYAEIREIEDFIEYNRRDIPAYGKSDALIDDIKQTIKDKGYVFDTDEVYRSAIAFPVGVDINGNIQIAEGNHRLTAALEVAKETGKNIYVPIYVYPGGTQVGSKEAAYRGKFRTVNPQDLHSALYQLFIDVGADEYSANEKVGKEFNTVRQYTGSNYLGAGGSGGNSTSQENIKKFFDAIGVNTYTYRNLPEDNIFKTGSNVFKDVQESTLAPGETYYHSRLEPLDTVEGKHFGTYDAAVARASLQYGNENITSFYSRALDEAYDFLTDEISNLELREVNGELKLPLVDNMQYQVEVENAAVPPKSKMWTWDIRTNGEDTIVLGYIDAENGLYYKIDEFFVDTIDLEQAGAKTMGDIDIEYIFGSRESFTTRDYYIGILQEAEPVDVSKAKVNFSDNYELHKTVLKSDAVVLDMSDAEITLDYDVRLRGEDKLTSKTSTVSSEFLQYRMFTNEDPSFFTRMKSIKIGDKIYKPEGEYFKSNQEIVDVVTNNADVIVYTNEIEDPGSKSIYINNPDAVETTIADQNELTEFNNDVKRKYVSTTVYDENINLLKALERNNITQELYNELSTINDGPALLETRFKYEFTQIPDETPRGYSVIKNKPQWQYDVVKPNKIFHPSKMTSAFGSLSKDGKEIINAYVKGTMTDKQATRLFIFLASHSDLPAWGFGKSYSARDAIGDIAKIGIMSDRPLDRVLPMGEPFMEKEFLNKIAMRNSDFFQAFDANAIKSEQLALRMLVDMQMERGQFTNFKERMRQVLIDEHNKIYRQNPNDYFILWRGGGLNRFNTWQSFSKRQEAAMGVMLQVKQQGAGQGGKLETYVLSKNNFIDLDSLGLSHGNEQEVIVLTEAATKPGAKIPDGLDDAKQIDAYIDSWAIRASEPEFYPKKGFAITNISQQLNQLGQGTQQFFTDVIQGMGDQAPKAAYEQLIDFNNKQLDTAQDIYNKFVVQGGDFNQHIFTSIPTFYEAQIVKGVALSNMLNNFEKVNVTTDIAGRESPKIKVLDIGATEGTWSKLLGSLNNNLEIDVLEPNPAAKKIFDESDQVDNVFFRQNAFSYLPEDQGKYFMEEGGSRNVNFFNFGAGEDVQFKYDVVHESMTFQFLDSNRKAQINFIADNVLTSNGILIIEEKFDADDALYQYNEDLKNNWKSQYYTPEQLATKHSQVVNDMGYNQISRLEIETILNTKFRYVNQYWSSGNFAGFIASNNPLADTFVDEINALDISLTDHEFSTNPTDEEIKYAINKQVEGSGINPDLHKAVVADMVDKNAGFINKVTDGLLGVYKGARSVGLAALGLGLKGLSKAAPVLEPGDVLIEKALQKSTPQIGRYASRLGFGFLPIKSIVPNYLALEIGMAAAEFVSAAMYAYNDYATAQRGGYMYEYQNIDGKTRYVPVKQEDGTPVYQPALNTYDFFRTPPGQEAIKDFNYNDFFLKELEKERVTQYSPGWSLSKAIFGLFGTMVDEQAKLSEQTRGDVGQALLTGIGK